WARAQIGEGKNRDSWDLEPPSFNLLSGFLGRARPAVACEPGGGCAQCEKESERSEDDLPSMGTFRAGNSVYGSGVGTIRDWSDWCLPKFNVRRVTALRQIDPNGIVSPFTLVIFAQSVAQARRFQAHNRIDIWIEFLGTVEDFPGDVVAFQPVAAAGQRFADDIFQELPPPPRLRERGALEDAVKLLANRFPI